MVRNLILLMYLQLLGRKNCNRINMYFYMLCIGYMHMYICREKENSSSSNKNLDLYATLVTNICPSAYKSTNDKNKVIVIENKDYIYPFPLNFLIHTSHFRM
jgi:hypothetical protein